MGLVGFSGGVGLVGYRVQGTAPTGLLHVGLLPKLNFFLRGLKYKVSGNPGTEEILKYSKITEFC